MGRDATQIMPFVLVNRITKRKRTNHSDEANRGQTVARSLFVEVNENRGPGCDLLCRFYLCVEAFVIETGTRVSLTLAASAVLQIA